MSTYADSTQAVPLSLGGSASAAARGRGFFSYHGIWAPGVRLFRSIGFGAKASLISFVFLLPLLYLAARVFWMQQDGLEFVRSERVGVAYARELTPLMKAAQDRRLHAVELARGVAAAREPLERARAAFDTQWKVLAAVEGRLGATLKTKELFTAADGAAKAMDGAGTPDEVFKRHAAAVEALDHLLGHVLDGSNLALDPELDTYYLMDAALVRMPVLQEQTAQLRALTAKARRQGGEPDAATLRALGGVEIAGDLADDALKHSLDKVLTAHPELRSSLDAKSVRERLHRFHEATQDASKSAEYVIGEGTAIVHGLYELQDRVIKELDLRLEMRESALARDRALTAVIVVLAVGLATYLFYAFYLVTHGGLNEVKRHLRAMTDGDLTTHPHPWGRDDAAQLMQSLAEMQESLRSIVGRVRHSADGIATASTQIAGGANDLSSRTEQTAANLEETASAMEQIAATVKHGETMVDEAQRLAAGNAEVAQRGGQIIGEVVETMHRINQSSGRISEIIGTIDGIAFQTNILALNAAVEAARAGEQGRGFAVVASEVRALAQRSSAAAREIKSLIGSSVEEVDNGTRVVQQAGATMSDIVGSASRMRELLDAVVHGSREQTAGVTQSARAVQELDGVTQQNAALVEQTAAAAGSLKDQAHDLASEVARFRLP